MHDALSVGRVHGGSAGGKGVLVGWFDVDGALLAGRRRADGGNEAEERGRRDGKGKSGDGGEEEDNKKGGRGEDDRGGKEVEKRSVVVVDKPTGQHTRTMGKADRQGRLWLLPEEVVYLVERGSLDVRYRVSSSSSFSSSSSAPFSSSSDSQRRKTTETGEIEGKEEEEEGGEQGREAWNGVSMSLQACYAWFMGRDGLDLERYVVFAGLRRSGYIVVRAPGWYDEGDDNKHAVSPVRVQQQQQQERRPEEKEDEGRRRTGGVWHWLYRNFLERKPQEPPPPLGPLVGKGLYRSY
ncbi:MAG: hypothetical protein L6R35_007549, partial [Caloplaca aegaea]